MPVAARKNTISEGESPISSVKYNEEIDNVYFSLNKAMSFFSGSSTPDEPMLNQYWLDTASNPAVLRRYDGSVWRWTGIHFGTTAPLNPISGAFFINSDAGTVTFWDGMEWQSLPGTNIGFDPGDTDLVSTNLEDALKEMYVSYLDTLAQAEIAVTAAGQASGYATAADEARAAAVTAQGLAEGAETGAVAAQGFAELAQGFAELAQGFAEDAQTDAENARDKARDWATKAEDSAVETGLYSALHHASKASASATSAASSETMAEKWAANPEDTEVETGLYSALHYAAKAEDSATSANSAATEATAAANLAFGATAPAWDPLETYDYPDVVAGSDGATYRCTGTGITTDPTTDQSSWKALVLVMLSTFEDDVLGDLMPVGSPIESYGWEIDASGDIMPAA